MPDTTAHEHDTRSIQLAEVHDLSVRINRLQAEADTLREQRWAKFQEAYDNGVTIRDLASAAGFTTEWAVRRRLTTRRAQRSTDGG